MSQSKRRSRHGQEFHNTQDEANVPVNEDYLFDVNIAQRELAPIYWLGPVYEGKSLGAIYKSRLIRIQYGVGPGSSMKDQH